MAETINHTERAHALLSASSSSRWLACTPSARLEERFPETVSKYAEEGTKAHEIAEKILRAKIDGKPKPGFKKEETKTIAKAVMPYVDYVWDLYTELSKEDPSTVVFLETRLDYSNWVPEGFGTGDAIILSGTTMHLLDLKFGIGVPVSAIENPQLRLYGLGGLNEYGDFYDIEQVVTHIVQPRLDSTSKEEISVKNLLDWAKIGVIRKARMAYKGEGDFVDGEHCKFCKANALCKHKLAKYTEITKLQNELPEQLASNGDLSKVLREASNIEKWLKAVKAYAISQMREGVKFKGLKLVAGRGSTKLTDPEKMVALLKKEGIAEALIYKERELVTKTEIKSLLGTKKFSELAEPLYEKLAGSPTIDLEESKKEEWQPGGDFGDIDTTKY